MWKGMYCIVYSIMYTAGELSNSVVWIVVGELLTTLETLYSGK